MQHGSTLFCATLAGVGLALAIHQLDWEDLWWKLAGPELRWPTVESYDLEFDVSRPGYFDARAVVELADIETRRLTLLLNTNLDVTAASVSDADANVECGIEVDHYRSLPSRYHREGRVVRFTLPAVPEGGRVSLTLSYAGVAEQGRTGSDWRGILFVDADQVRMCEQTIFYPQVPLSLEGAAKAKAPFKMDVVAPRDWEIFAPGSGGDGTEQDGSRRWSFRTDRPRHPSLLGGRLERTETAVGGSRIVTLLLAEHAHLAPDFVREASLAIDSFTQTFGAIDAGVIGIVEIQCRDSSYNWTGEGVMAFDRGALGREVPVPSLAHEVAHLWWGQAVDATGPGERFLTEGLAEYSAWIHLLDGGRAELVQSTLQSARRRVADLSERGASVALADVAFELPDYSTLAYEKGPLVLRSLRQQLGEGQLDTALMRLVEIGRERQVELADFEQAVRDVSGLEELRLPWLESPGDVTLALEDVRVAGDLVSATILAALTPVDSEMDVRGTPLALQMGGRGWTERQTVLLAGQRTLLRIELEGRELAYLRLDPGEAWTYRIDNGLHVLNGAELLGTDPPTDRAIEFGGTRIELRFDRRLAVPALEPLIRAQLAPTSEGQMRLRIESVALEDDSRTLVVITEPWLPDRRYQLALTSLVDHEHLPLVPAAFDLDIAPSTDTQPARIVATVPAVGARVRAPGGELELSITFDEPMQDGFAIRGTAVREIESRGLRYARSGGAAHWDKTGRTIIWPCQDLQVGETYALPIRSVSFHDLSGNGCEELDLTFTVVE